MIPVDYADWLAELKTRIHQSSNRLLDYYSGARTFATFGDRLLSLLAEKLSELQISKCN